MLFSKSINTGWPSAKGNGSLLSGHCMLEQQSRSPCSREWQRGHTTLTFDRLIVPAQRYGSFIHSPGIPIRAAPLTLALHFNFGKINPDKHARRAFDGTIRVSRNARRVTALQHSVPSVVDIALL